MKRVVQRVSRRVGVGKCMLVCGAVTRLSFGSGLVGNYGIDRQIAVAEVTGWLQLSGRNVDVIRRSKRLLLNLPGMSDEQVSKM